MQQHTRSWTTARASLKHCGLLSTKELNRDFFLQFFGKKVKIQHHNERCCSVLLDLTQNSTLYKIYLHIIHSHMCKNRLLFDACDVPIYSMGTALSIESIFSSFSRRTRHGTRILVRKSKRGVDGRNWHVPEVTWQELNPDDYIFITILR